MQIFSPFHGIIIFNIDITFFVIYSCLIFAVNYVSGDEYDCSSDNEFGYVFAVHTICLLTLTFVAFERISIINWKKLTQKCVNRKFDTIVQHVINLSVRLPSKIARLSHFRK